MSKDLRTSYINSRLDIILALQQFIISNRYDAAFQLGISKTAVNDIAEDQGNKIEHETLLRVYDNMVERIAENALIQDMADNSISLNC